MFFFQFFVLVPGGKNGWTREPGRLSGDSRGGKERRGSYVRIRIISDLLPLYIYTVLKTCLPCRRSRTFETLDPYWLLHYTAKITPHYCQVVCPRNKSGFCSIWKGLHIIRTSTMLCIYTKYHIILFRNGALNSRFGDKWLDCNFWRQNIHVFLYSRCSGKRATRAAVHTQTLRTTDRNQVWDILTSRIKASQRRSASKYLSATAAAAAASALSKNNNNSNRHPRYIPYPVCTASHRISERT